MKKLCCIPCNETPNVRLNFKCVCCGSKNVESLSRKGKSDNSNHSSSDGNISEAQDCAKTCCGCSTFIKHSSKTKVDEIQKDNE